jgi:dCMP deaminase
MACKNCDPGPGKYILTTPDFKQCVVCGDSVVGIHMGVEYIHEKNYGKQVSKWDSYFHLICDSVAFKSPCLSRKIGAILVRDNSIISTGYNGPPRGIPHCGHEKFMKDENLSGLIAGMRYTDINNTCPRKLLGFISGEGMELCPAQHAEENAISNAARLGVSVLNSTLYMNCVIPCQKCFGTLINAGIVEIVVDKVTVYDKHTQFLIDNSFIEIREFEL